MLSPAKRTAARARHTRDLEFDQKHGVDTGGSIPLSELDVETDNWIHGAMYQAMAPVDFGKVLEPFHIRYDDFTFIDFGSGKGRAILLASSLPFKKIVGVEFSRTLHEIALKNLDAFTARNEHCGGIESHCMDAVEYPLPVEPLVLYLFNPFGEPVMQKLVNNVVASLRLNPRRIVVVYSTPLQSKVWDSVNHFHKLSSSEALCLYDTKGLVLQ
jgi:hypothetical protein